MKRLRALFSILLVSLAVAACAPNQLAQLASGGNAFPTLLAGLSDRELDGYLSWWRGGTGSAYGVKTPEIIDARCKLRFASRPYREGEPLPIGASGESQRLYASEVKGSSGFYSTSRMEVLILLEGQMLSGNADSSSNYRCTYDSSVYIPVRVNLRTGDYQVEGWVNPAATVQVDVRTLKSAQLVADTSGQYDRNQSGPLYSPLRLNRFAVTEANLQRVLDFARIYNYSDSDLDVATRRIHWFRTADIAPYFADKAKGCPGAAFAYAFWDKFDDFKSGSGCKPTGSNGVIGGANIENALTITSDLYIDRMARMGTAGEIESGRTVESYSDDDRDCEVSAPNCNISNAAWTDVRKQLALVVATASSSSSGGDGNNNAKVRATAWAKIKELFKGSPNTLSDGISAPDPRMLDAEGNLQADVVGIIAGHGQKAWEDLDLTLKDGPPLKRFGSFVAAGEPYDSGTVLVTPSFEITTVGGAGGTEEQRAWLESHSALFGASEQVQFMVFRTALSNGDTKGGLPFTQGALSRMTISVGGATISNASRSVYVSDYIPLSVIGRLADRTAAGVNTSYEPWDPAGWVQTINNFVVNIYKGTFGAAMSSLSSFAVSGLASLPTLSRFELDGTASDARASANAQVKRAYRFSDRVDVSVFRGDGGNLNSVIATLPDEKQACTYAASQGLLNPTTVDHADGDYYFTYPADSVTRHSVADCYVANPVYGLFQLSRAMSLLLFMLFTALFFFRLGTGRAKDMTITGFGARAVIALAVILGMDFIIGVAAAIVSEVVTLTNYFGTVLSGGKPYSYLWLFGSYLSNPDINAANVFSLIMLMPFSLVGLLVLAIVNFLRNMVTIAVLALAPLWVISLMYKTESRFFERSLLLLLRVYLIPLFTLITLMALFLFFPLSTDMTTSGSEFGIIGAVLGLLAMLLAVIIPFFLSNLIIRRYGERVVSGMRSALNAARNNNKADLLEAGMRGAAANNTDSFGSDASRAMMNEFRGQLPAKIAASERADGSSGGRSGGGLIVGPKRPAPGSGPGSEGGEPSGTPALSAGGAQSAIAAERAKQGGIFARLRNAKQSASARYLAAGGGKAGTFALLRAGASSGIRQGLGASASLMKWSARYATDQLIGQEYRDTKAYGTAKLGEAKAKLISAGQSIGAVGADGMPNLDSAAGRLYASGLTLAAATREEVGSYTREKLSVARSAFTAGIDAERQYLAAETKISAVGRALDEARSEREALALSISSNAFGDERSVEGKKRRTALATLDAQIAAQESDLESARGVRVIAAATLAAAAQSTTGALGNNLYALRDSAVGNEIFGSSDAARARNDADANAAAAEAVIRRTNEEMAALDVERNRLELAGDRSGATRVAAMISTKAALRDEVLVEQESYRNDATRRRLGGAASAELATDEATRAAMAALGRSGAARVRQTVNEANSRIEAVNGQIAAVEAADAQHRAAVAAGSISGPSPYEEELRRLAAERAAEQARAAAAEQVAAEARGARAIAQTWQWATNGQLPDGTRISVTLPGVVTAAGVAAGVVSFATGATIDLPPQSGERGVEAAEVSRRLDEKLNRLGFTPAPAERPSTTGRPPVVASEPEALPAERSGGRPAGAPPVPPRSAPTTGASTPLRTPSSPDVPSSPPRPDRGAEERTVTS